MSKKVKHKESTTEEVFKNLEATASRSEKFVEENKNLIVIAVVAIVVLIGSYMAFQNYVLVPMEKKATNELFNAKKYFEVDSLNLALNGDGQYRGFVDIADEYSLTKTGNLANFYAGISYYRLGEYQNAVEYLEKFDSDDKIVGAVAKGTIADSFIALGQFEDALDYYIKAADANNNEFSTPLFLFKAGNVALKVENYSKAESLYQRISDEFPKSQEGQNIEKYIARAQAAQK